MPKDLLETSQFVSNTEFTIDCMPAVCTKQINISLSTPFTWMQQMIFLLLTVSSC